MAGRHLGWHVCSAASKCLTQLLVRLLCTSCCPHSIIKALCSLCKTCSAHHLRCNLKCLACCKMHCLWLQSKQLRLKAWFPKWCRGLDNAWTQRVQLEFSCFTQGTRGDCSFTGTFLPMDSPTYNWGPLLHCDAPE